MKFSFSKKTIGRLLSGVGLLFFNPVDGGAQESREKGAEKPLTKTVSTEEILNTWMRRKHSEFDRWDIGGVASLRLKAYDDAILSFPNRDFQARGVSNDNSYFWLR